MMATSWLRRWPAAPVASVQHGSAGAGRRLANVHAERLHDEIDWMMQMHSSDAVSRPAVLSRFSANVAEDAPIPRIILRGNEIESAHIIRSVYSACAQRGVTATKYEQGVKESKRGSSC